MSIPSTSSASSVSDAEEVLSDVHPETSEPSVRVVSGSSSPETEDAALAECHQDEEKPRLATSEPPVPSAAQLSIRAFPALHTFPTVEIYADRLSKATMIEMDNDCAIIKQLNDAKKQHRGWVICPIPGTMSSFVKPWLVLVQMPRGEEKYEFPVVADQFSVSFSTLAGETICSPLRGVYFQASRIPNPYETVEGQQYAGLKAFAAFKVDIRRSRKTEDGTENIEDILKPFQIADTLEQHKALRFNPEQSLGICIHWDVSTTTFDAELAALYHLTEGKQLDSRKPSAKSLEAFAMIRDFKKVSSRTNLHKPFPHLEDPRDRRHRLPNGLLDKVSRFNRDHWAALDGLKAIPNGLYFVNGCPGSGKTHLNLVLSALMQCKRPQWSRGGECRILFIVDINKAVDDAADRYFRLSRDIGAKTRIVRMHGWPHEMKHSDHLKPNAEKNSNFGMTDFTKAFLLAANLARHLPQKSADRAPTLDEAAWEFYDEKRDELFPALSKMMNRISDGDRLTAEEWKALRNQVNNLYRKVLNRTQFIATTPVAAYGNFPKYWNPDIIFVDEAPHARELTTLIPIAFYSPVAWIFTGDVKQTRPFVKSEGPSQAARAGLKWNPYADQLRISAMARADMVGAIERKLLVNHRSKGNLHLLPSKLFYDGQMTTCYTWESIYCAPARFMRLFLEGLGGRGPLLENRVIVWPAGSAEEHIGKSFWNPKHHGWLLSNVASLLQNDEFGGSIMILTPYSSAVREYYKAWKQWPKEWQERVQVMTVDKSQGKEADVVYLDLVRSSTAGFLDDPKRLNVAVTRARLAEIILMNPGMRYRKTPRGRMPSQWISQM